MSGSKFLLDTNAVLYILGRDKAFKKKNYRFAIRFLL